MTCRCVTGGHGLVVGLEVLDSKILEGFPNLNDFVVLRGNLRSNKMETQNPCCPTAG